MKTILFATGNARKIAEARTTLAPYDITIEPIKLSIEEIQHNDPTEITNAKAHAAFDIVKKPVVVSDTSWDIPALGGFPGGYMKDIEAWFAADDWLSLINRHEDRTIYCLEHVTYFDGTTLKHFSHRYTGTFVDKPRGRVQDDESFEQVVSLYGDKTMAEQLAYGDIASAGETLEHWRQFAAWYSDATHGVVS